MKKISKRPKYRALELYAANSPFKPKIVKSKKLYSRKKNAKICPSKEH